MVEYTLNLDSIFASLANPTRRDILRRLAREEQTIGALAEPYKMSFAAVSKHLQVLEKARLVVKRKQGNEQIVQMAPQALAEAGDFLDHYLKLWEDRMSNLDDLLKQEQTKANKKG